MDLTRHVSVSKPAQIRAWMHMQERRGCLQLPDFSFLGREAKILPLTCPASCTPSEQAMHEHAHERDGKLYRPCRPCMVQDLSILAGSMKVLMVSTSCCVCLLPVLACFFHSV